MSNPDPIRDAIDRLDAIPTDVATGTSRRPNKATVTRLLAAHGSPVTVTETTVTEDVDGIPTGTHTTEHAATLDVDLAHLGWTQAEYDNPAITE